MVHGRELLFIIQILQQRSNYRDRKLVRIGSCLHCLVATVLVDPLSTRLRSLALIRKHC
jgi:hypothetical protein